MVYNVSNPHPNPFKALPKPDPAADANGIIWSDPHAHALPLPEAFLTVQSALRDHRAGDSDHLMGAWMLLTHACFIGAQLALINVGLTEMSEALKKSVARILTGEPVHIPGWAGDLIANADDQANVPAKSYADGLLMDLRSASVQFIAIAEPNSENQKSADSALFAVALVSAYREVNGASVDALLHENTDPAQVMWALFGLHDVVIQVLAEHTGMTEADAAASLNIDRLKG